MDLKKLKEILKIVEKTDFHEVEIVEKDWRLRVERHSGQPMTVTYPSMPAQMGQQMSMPMQQQAPRAEAPQAAAPKVETGHIITSPFVGTFYRSPSPDAAAFVDVGHKVQKGQTICIIEAMKLMNEIESDFDGKIVEIYPPNGSPVEFGEKLFRIE